MITSIMYTKRSLYSTNMLPLCKSENEGHFLNIKKITLEPKTCYLQFVKALINTCISFQWYHNKGLQTR
jgi:hypothetical protein